MSDWTQYKSDQKQRRIDRLPVRQMEIESLSELGYTVEKKTEYQYRINGLIDLYPIHNRWHNIKTSKRGGAKSLKQFILNTIKI